MHVVGGWDADLLPPALKYGPYPPSAMPRHCLQSGEMRQNQAGADKQKPQRQSFLADILRLVFAMPGNLFVLFHAIPRTGPH